MTDQIPIFDLDERSPWPMPPEPVKPHRSILERIAEWLVGAEEAVQEARKL